MDRRKFLSNIAFTSAALSLGIDAEALQTETRTFTHPLPKSDTALPNAKSPVIISKSTGIQSSQDAYKVLSSGGDTLDAVIRVLKGQEDDPNDDTVGLGGLPNEEGVVELDSCVMHGPTRRAGAVGGMRNIKNVCMVARAVMERTNHLMLVGEGAERFAVAQGFPRENLLTDRSRKIWLLWKETNSNQDDWGPGISAPEWKPPQDVPPGMPPMVEQKQSLLQEPRIQRMYSVAADLGIPEDERLYAIHRVLFPPTGTIHCSVVNTKGEMSGGTTTSGLAWKLPGRVGDSPIIGAGNYCDQDVGSAGATGSGEENIKIAGAHTIVENMRHGMTPIEAGMDALQRMVRNYRGKEERLRFLDMVFYILRKDGQYAGVALWSNRKSNGSMRQFQVNTDGKPRLEDCVALFEGSAIGWPFEPTLPKGS